MTVDTGSIIDAEDRLQRQLTIAQVMLQRGTDQIAAVSTRLREHDENLHDELESALYFIYIADDEIQELLDT